jgi:hypothetical protein
MRLWRPRTLIDVELPAAALLSFRSEIGDELEFALHPWPLISEAGRLEWPTAPSSEFRIASDSWRRKRFGVFRGMPISLDLTEGHVYAVGVASEKNVTSTGGEVTLDALTLGSGPLADVTEELEQAAGSTFVPCGWAVWFAWHGDVELIGQIARASSRLFEESFGHVAQLAITVTTLGDPESFSSVAAFRADLTDQAKKRLDSARIVASDGGTRVDVTIARTRDDERPWLRKAVVLEVVSTSPADIDAVLEVRDGVRVAINRGRMRGGDSGRPDAAFCERTAAGEVLPVGAGPETVIERRVSPYLILAVVVAVLYYVLVTPIFQVFGWGGLVSLVVNGAIGGIFGAILGSIYIYSGIEVRGTPRLRRLRASAKLAVTTVLGVVVPLLIKQVLAVAGFETDEKGLTNHWW